ncbi:hypothetical protein B9Z55_021508 [Caenorhabditis nigoni]|uniref:Uncharacterized protein n=1 Tax=Caenorhabditis nigoni TaxID=1611254 RepID=A0A2G5TSV0_9PELO|nr:hypothetical protein B9Z55_021508 [Caenorhabditis nigoni]
MSVHPNRWFHRCSHGGCHGYSQLHHFLHYQRKKEEHGQVRNGRHVKIQSSLMSSAPSDAPSSQEAKCWSVESQRQETPALSV